jgi:hypothetical protein
MSEQKTEDDFNGRQPHYNPKSTAYYVNWRRNNSEKLSIMVPNIFVRSDSIPIKFQTTTAPPQPLTPHSYPQLTGPLMSSPTGDHILSTGLCPPVTRWPGSPRGRPALICQSGGNSRPAYCHYGTLGAGHTIWLIFLMETEQGSHFILWGGGEIFSRGRWEETKVEKLFRTQMWLFSCFSLSFPLTLSVCPRVKDFKDCNGKWSLGVERLREIWWNCVAKTEEPSPAEVYCYFL